LLPRLGSVHVSVRIALVGDENETYPSHREINAVRPLLGDDVESVWVATDIAQVRDLSGFDGIWLVPGSPYRDDESAYSAVPAAGRRPGGQARASAPARIRPLRRRASAIRPAWHDLDMTQQLRPTTW